MKLIYDKTAGTVQLVATKAEGEQVTIPVDTTQPAPGAVLSAKAAAEQRGGM